MERGKEEKGDIRSYDLYEYGLGRGNPRLQNFIT